MDQEVNQEVDQEVVRESDLLGGVGHFARVQDVQDVQDRGEPLLSGITV
jgi:hypothetical protein